MCTARFEQLNDVYESLNGAGYGSQVKLIGIGKSQHIASLDNWTSGNNASVCADQSPYSTWNDWGAAQRDLYILDYEGNVMFHENVSGGIPADLQSLVIDLIEQIPADCNPDLVCGEAITCCNGLQYPTTCCSENCDEPMGECGECVDGEFNNDNPCNPMECWNGEWIEIVIDCAEQMGVPCDGGVYIPPADGECCSICIILGDLSGDDTINILDVVAMVNLVLSGAYYEVADMNGDGTLNVLDIVSLVNIILS